MAPPPYPLPAEPTLVHTLLRRAVAEPAVVFAEFEERPQMSLGEMAEAVRDFAGGIHCRSLGRGDRVLLALDNSPEFVVAWLGTWHAGATIVPLVPSAGTRLFQRALTVARPALAVANAEGAESLVSCGGDRVETLQVGGPADEPLDPAVAGFSSPGDRGENLARGEDLAAVMFTSGTTGPPKGVCLEHLWYVWASEDVIRGMEYASDDVLFTCLPLGHANAQDTTFGPALICGGRVALERRFSASRFWRRLEETGATAFNLIGNMPRVLLSREAAEYAPGHRAERAFAVPALPHYRDEFASRFGVELRQGYGSTELGMPVFEQPGRHRRGSCGTPSPGTEVAIYGEGQRLPAGETGEIRVRSKRPGAITSGYLEDPKRSADALAEGWFRTGDIGRLDEDGYLYFAGRLGDALRRRGENVSLHEVESALLSLESVGECAAIGRRAAAGEDEVVVYVVATEGREVDADELRRRCVSILGRVGEPDEVNIVRSLPRTESGKVAKGQLATSTGATA